MKFVQSCLVFVALGVTIGAGCKPRDYNAGGETQAFGEPWQGNTPVLKPFENANCRMRCSFKRTPIFGGKQILCYNRKSADAVGSFGAKAVYVDEQYKQKKLRALEENKAYCVDIIPLTNVIPDPRSVLQRKAQDADTLPEVSKIFIWKKKGDAESARAGGSMVAPKESRAYTVHANPNDPQDTCFVSEYDWDICKTPREMAEDNTK